MLLFARLKRPDLVDMFSQVGPRDGGYGIGRYRLALDAGSTDCSFRLLLWNRTATAEVHTQIDVFNRSTASGKCSDYFLRLLAVL